MPTVTSSAPGSTALHADGAVRPAAATRLAQLPPCRIAILGAGTMGCVIARGIVQGGLPAERITVTSRRVGPAEAVAHDLGITAAPDNLTACADADVVLICVKPADVVGLLDELVQNGAIRHAPLLISIAAGVRIASVEERTRSSAPVLRAMPNTPCSIGHGMTVVSRGTLATDAHLEIGRTLFGTLGRCMVLDERHLDAVTALSASGPAFVYVLLEAFAEGGVMCGLPRDVATEMAAQMALGACQMVLATGRHPASLKDEVTTPAGCTIAGLLALEDGRVRSVLARAIQTTADVAGRLK